MKNLFSAAVMDLQSQQQEEAFQDSCEGLDFKDDCGCGGRRLSGKALSVEHRNESYATSETTSLDSSSSSSRGSCKFSNINTIDQPPPQGRVVVVDSPLARDGQKTNKCTGRITSPCIVPPRKMSTAVVTDESTHHDLIPRGRPKVICRTTSGSGTVAATHDSCTGRHGGNKDNNATAAAGSSLTKPGRHLLPKLHGNSVVSSTRGGSGVVSAQAQPPIIKRTTTVPIDDRLSEFVSCPAPPLSVKYWSEPPADHFSVRGRNYLRDQKKIPSVPSVFQLMAVDLIHADRPILEGLCGHPNERIQQALRRERETGVQELPEFIFAINYCVPCEPYFHWIAYFGIDDVRQLQDVSTPLGRLARPFFFGDDDAFRTSAFKLIPRIVEGNFVVRKAVGSKPTILGRKLKQHYHKDPSGENRYFELVVDIGSDAVADKIVKLALGYAKSLTVDMMFLLEGNTPQTLPEQILGGVRMHHPEVKRLDLQRKIKIPPVPK